MGGNPNLILIGYAIYLPVAITLTFLVSKTLFRSGQYFMLDIFRGKEEIATATNKLFEVGFYLLNIGYALLIIRLTYIKTPQGLVESLSEKIGGFAIYLGIVLFLNLFLFLKGRKNVRAKMNLESEPTPAIEG